MSTKKVLFKNLVEVVDENYQGGKGHPLNRYPIRPFQNVAPVEDFNGGSSGASFSFVNETVPITGSASGSVLNISATGTGVTASFVSGTFTINVPVGKSLISVHLLIRPSDVQVFPDAGGFTQWVKVRFVNPGGNSSLNDIRIPNVQKLALPSFGDVAENNAGAIDNDNNPFVSLVECLNGNITIRINGLSVGSQGYLLSFTGF